MAYHKIETAAKQGKIKVITPKDFKIRRPLVNPIVVDPTIAKKIGLNEAIIFQQIHYWLVKNQEKDKNFIDGRYWTYNSFENWQKQFPFWSTRTIRRITTRLSSYGIVIIKIFNKKCFDKTNWYTINYEKAKEILESTHKDKLSLSVVTN
jgi:hypothetical protein